MQNIKSVWDFVEKYYPNYTSSDEISENDDLHKIFDGQLDGYALEMYTEKFNEVRGNTNGMLNDTEIKERVLNHFEELKSASDASIYEAAIQGFIDSQKEPKKTYYLFGEDAVKELNENGILVNDLFNEDPESLPQELQDALNAFAEKEGDSYENCAELVKELNKIGYTCEYYLDAQPFNLRKL